MNHKRSNFHLHEPSADYGHDLYNRIYYGFIQTYERFGPENGSRSAMSSVYEPTEKYTSPRELLSKEGASVSFDANQIKVSVFRCRLMN